MSFVSDQYEAKIAAVNQLMAAQSMFNVFPDEGKLCEFACHALLELSAVECCCAYLREADQVVGPVCPAAEQSLKMMKAVPGEVTHPELELPSSDRIRAFTLRTTERTYGYLMVYQTSVAEFTDQEPLVNNFTNMIAFDLERRYQNEALQKYREHLEEMVESRAADLLGEIADRKNVELSLRESEEKFRTIIESSPDGFWIADLEGRFREVNDSYVKMSGYSRDELLGMKITDVEATETPAEVAKNLEAIKAAVTVRFERIQRRKDGSSFNVDICVQYQDVDGGRFVVFLRDITEYKKQQDLLEKAQELGQIGTWELDLVNNTLHWTDENCRIFGVPPGTVADYDLFLSKVHPDDHEYVDREWTAAVAGNPYDIEHRLLIDGKTNWVREKADLQFDDDGNPVSAIGFTQDITRFKELEQEKVDFEKKILHTQKLESLGVLAGGIAHDFNNILMSILGYTDLALFEISPTSTAGGYLQSITDSTRKAADLVQQMLAYSGKGKFSLESMDLNSLINDTIQMFKISISKSVVLRYRLSPEPVLVEGDPSQIRQIIMNLVINASDAVGKKSGVIALATGSMYCDRQYIQESGFDIHVADDKPIAEGMYSYLEVSDTGEGIEQENLQKIFEPFFTTKFTGRGLGLSAVLGIVQGHSGLVKIDSVPGRGSTFKVLFPLLTESGGLQPEQVNLPKAQGKWQGQGTFLVADDEEDVRSVSQHMLQRLGFEVLLAEDGNEAVAVFKQHADKIVCILLDLTMPHKDGAEVYQEVRQLNPDIKVILTSGYNEQDATQQFIGKGLAGFIQKPYTTRELAGKVEDVMSEHESH